MAKSKTKDCTSLLSFALSFRKIYLFVKYLSSVFTLGLSYITEEPYQTVWSLSYLTFLSYLSHQFSIRIYCYCNQFLLYSSYMFVASFQLSSWSCTTIWCIDSFYATNKNCNSEIKLYGTSHLMMHQQALNIISFLFLRNSYDGLRRCQRADSGIAVETIQARVGYPSFKCTRYEKSEISKPCYCSCAWSLLRWRVRASGWKRTYSRTRAKGKRQKPKSIREASTTVGQAGSRMFLRMWLHSWA